MCNEILQIIRKFKANPFFLSIDILSIVLLSIDMLSIVLLSIDMLSIVLLSIAIYCCFQ